MNVVEPTFPFQDAITDVVPSANPVIRACSESRVATDTMLESPTCQWVKASASIGLVGPPQTPPDPAAKTML